MAALFKAKQCSSKLKVKNEVEKKVTEPCISQIYQEYLSLYQTKALNFDGLHSIILKSKSKYPSTKSANKQNSEQTKTG